MSQKIVFKEEKKWSMAQLMSEWATMVKPNFRLDPVRFKL